MLLRAVDEVRRVIQENGGTNILEVNAGASACLLAFTPTTFAPEEIRQSVIQALAAHPLYRLGTFVASLQEVGENFACDRAALLAKNRWEQMQTSSLVYPDLQNGKYHDQWVCEADHLRPAAAHYRHWDAEQREWRDEVLSQSTYARHEYGKEERKNFYHTEASLAVPCLVNDLNEMAADGPQGPLNGKISVIHVDGNGFGKLFLDRCSNPEQQGKASRALRGCQAEFLRRLFQAIEEHGDGWYYSRETEDGEQEAALRLETLQWGGDELTFVVPAWKGWYFLDLFFRLASGWRPFGADVPVTHCGGLVFCNRKCDIHTAAHLAKELCETAKEVYAARDQPAGMTGNLLAYQVLESFDHIGKRVDAKYFNKRYRFLPHGDAGPIVLPASKLGGLWKAERALRDAIPRRKVHEIVRALVAGHANKAGEVIQDTWKGLGSAPEAQAQFLEFAELLGGADEKWPAAWFHFHELWDYIGFEDWQWEAAP